MNGLINMSRIVTVAITPKDDRWFLVFNTGRINYGMEVPNEADARELLDFIMKKKPAYFRVKTPLVNVNKL